MRKFAAILILYIMVGGTAAAQHVEMDGVKLGVPFTEFVVPLTERMSATHMHHLDIPNRCFFYFYRSAQLVIYITPKTGTVYRLERRYRVVTDDYNHLDMAYQKLFKSASQYGAGKQITNDNYPDRDWELEGGKAELRVIYMGGEYFVLLTITDDKALKLLKKEGGKPFLAHDPRVE